MWQLVRDNPVTSIYTDVGTTSIAAAYQASGQKYYALAFLLADAGSCQPAWDGTHSLSENFYAGEIETIRAHAGDVNGVFGGAGGSDLASACPTVDQLHSAYQSVIDQYQFKWLDWLIDSSMLSDRTSLQRRNEAVAALQANNPTLKVSYTLPITRAGLAQPALDLLSNAKAKGVRIDYVNLLAMNYGPPTPDMGEAARHVAALAHDQLARLGFSSKIGLTALIGENSDPGEVFSLANADALIAFARANSYVGWLSFWSLGRDAGGCSSSTTAGASCSGIVQDDYAFTRRFETFP